MHMYRFMCMDAHPHSLPSKPHFFPPTHMMTGILKNLGKSGLNSKGCSTIHTCVHTSPHTHMMTGILKNLGKSGLNSTGCSTNTAMKKKTRSCRVAAIR